VVGEDSLSTGAGVLDPDEAVAPASIETSSPRDARRSKVSGITNAIAGMTISSVAMPNKIRIYRRPFRPLPRAFAAVLLASVRSVDDPIPAVSHAGIVDPRLLIERPAQLVPVSAD
jgi:hypothetical protein